MTAAKGNAKGKGTAPVPQGGVLVVDDSVAIRTVLKDLLAERGITDVMEASGVEDALGIFTERRPKLVFLDMVMPKFSGMTFLQNALKMEPRTKVVVMTALAPDDKEVTLAVAEGAFDYLPKPLRRDIVNRVLDRLADDRAPKKRSDDGYA